MEAVAADAVVIEPAGQGEPVGELGMAAVEGGVEAGDLRQVGVERGDRTDPCEIVRLMQGRERAERLEIGEHPGIDAHRCCVMDAAMHHPVADGEQCFVAEEFS